MGCCDVTESAQVFVSSEKEGHEAQYLLDDDPNTFWQYSRAYCPPLLLRSNGQLPHHLHFDFPLRVRLRHVEVDISPDVDDSYTPLNFIVMAGDSQYHLLDVLTYTVPESARSTIILDLFEANDNKTVDAFSVRILVTSNYSNGKDSRIRGIRLFAVQ